jgi:hypothetical protein
LVISNYAFSELPAALQRLCLDNVTCKSEHGYLTINSDPEGGFAKVNNMSLAELREAIPKASRIKETPRTNLNNYILAW